MVGDRAGAGDAWVHFSEIQFARLFVDQEVQLEVAAIALFLQGLAHGERCRARGVDDGTIERLSIHFIATPAAFVWRQLLETDQLDHDRGNDGAMSSHASFYGRTT